MFILSKRNFLVTRKDGSQYRIAKDFVGEIPEDVGQSWLVQQAIKGGWVATPEKASDAVLERSSEEADKISADFDKRPDKPKKRTRKAD